MYKMKAALYNRILSAILAFVMFFGALPLPARSTNDEQTQVEAAAASPLQITLDGVPTESMELRPHEKIEILAECGEDAAQYQWQILHPEKENLWVNIYDATAQSLPVTLALVGNMLSDENVAQLRCRAQIGENTQDSPVIAVRLVEEDAALTADTAEEASEETSSPVEVIADAASKLADGVLSAFAVPAQAAETDESEFVTVTIEYIRYDYKPDGTLDTQGSQAFTPYVATLHYGSELKSEEGEEVHFPTLVGYDTWLVKEDASLESATELAFDLDEVKEDITYTVKYLPADVDYTIRYFLQNVYDDLYVEATDAVEHLKGKTGSAPDATKIAKEFDGFVSLYYQPDSIAADGSTVFEVFYERSYYLMEFNCDGGYGADTLYVRYGTYISVPNPVKTGWIFRGWDLVNAKDEEGNQLTLKTDADNNLIPYTPAAGDGITPIIYGDKVVNPLLSTMPCFNTAYKALWDTTETKYTIVYWAENANNGYYSYWDTAPADAISATTIIPSDVAALDENSAETNDLTDWEHFYYNEAKTIAENPASVTVEGDGSTVINVYYSRNRYTIYFIQSGTTCQLEEHTHSNVCMSLACSYTHVHDEGCVKTLYCTTPEHTAHTAECLTCDESEHAAHTESCYACNQMAHAHSLENGCYKLNCNKTSHSHSTSGCATGNCDHECDLLCTIFGCQHNHIDICYSCGQTEGTHTHTIDAGCYDLTCVKTEHDHTASCGYKDELHTHDNSCYTDIIHTHTDNCYTWSCGEDSHVHSDVCYFLDCKKTEHTHNSNWDWSCGSNGNNCIHSITAKYDADIKSVWENDPIASHLANGYVWESNITGKYYSFLEKMPGYDVKMTRYEFEGWNKQPYTWHYYLQLRPGETTTVDTKEGEDGYIYKWYHTSTVTASGLSLTYEEDYFPITGYKQVLESPNVPDFENRVAYLYYYYKTPTLKYYNYSESGPTPASKNLYYEQPLKSFEISKEVMEESYYPAGLEPGAYEFGGWYTSPGCYDGSEVDWDKDTMPDTDLEIYAKWTPVVHDVYFYYLYDDIEDENYWKEPTDENGDRLTDGNGNPITISYPIEAEHGSLLGTTYNYKPTRDKYTFIGWFYMDQDNKKRFAPDTMEITQELHLFAEWQSGITTTYEVTYTLRDEYTVTDGTTSTTYPAGYVIAKETAGYSTAGKTKTFTAKAGSDLYVGFQSKFFPTANSHSILMNEDGTQNTYTFEYVYDDVVLYKVRYVNSLTGEVMGESAPLPSYNAIVTEKFKPFSGFIPQSYYIRKALAYDGNATTPIDANIITFYYTPDTEHGLYSVEYYLEYTESTNPDLTSNYYLYESIVGSSDLKDSNGNPTVHYADLREYEGYTHKPSLNTVITYNTDGSVKSTTTGVGATNTPPKPYGTVEYTGLTIKIYYECDMYPYVIEYREANTEAVLHPDDEPEDVWEIEKKNFGSTLTHTALASFTSGGKTYEYYIPNSTVEARTQTRTIRKNTYDMNTGVGELAPNVLTFYYTQKQVEVQYHAICLDEKVPASMRESMKDIGRVSKNAEKGQYAGSTALALTGFRFVGWYSDETCQTLVTTSAFYRPTDLTPDDDWISHFYALFEPVKEDLTIIKTDGDDDQKLLLGGKEKGDTFLFQITGNTVLNQTENPDVNLIISIQGEGSVTIKDLYCGDYTVKELTNWSWTYSCENFEQEVTLLSTDKEAENNDITIYTVTFINSPKTVDWLHGESEAKENQFQ